MNNPFIFRKYAQKVEVSPSIASTWYAHISGHQKKYSVIFEGKQDAFQRGGLVNDRENDRWKT